MDRVPAAMPPIASYELAMAPGHDRATLEIRPQRDGTVLWGIFDDTRGCLTEPGVWEIEPRPSSRGDDYLARSRRTLPECLALWERHVAASLAGGTWGGAVVGSARAEACERLHDPGGIVARATSRTDSPKVGSWVSAQSLAEIDVGAPSGDSPWDAADADIEVRRVLGLVALEAFRTRAGRVPVVAGGGFAGGVRVGLRLGGTRDDVPTLARDLLACVRDRRAEGLGFGVGLGSLSAEGDVVHVTGVADGG